MTEGFGDVVGTPFTSAGLLHNTGSIGLGDLNLLLIKVLLYVLARDVTLFLCRGRSWDTPFFRNQRENRVSLISRYLLPVARRHVARMNVYNDQSGS